MYCSFCNSQLPDGVFVCAVCGHDNTPVTKVAEEIAPAVNEAPATAPAVEQTPYYAYEAAAYAREAAYAPEAA